MSTFDAAAVMAGLTGFQRRTVDHVMDRFHGGDPANRFLVSDETGLGKSLVARGVIARTIEQLQHEPRRQQVNVVYVCSNTDLATQNLKRLDVTGGQHTAVPSRLSLLAKHSRELQPDLNLGHLAVNLVSFTPGTSFGKGHQSGQVQERALLLLLLGTVLDLTGWNRHAALTLLRGTVGSRETFENRIAQFEAELDGPPDPGIANKFRTACKRTGLLSTFEELLVDIGRRRDVPESMQPRVRVLISKMRAELARAGLAVLDPDLVILDEFQRFPELLDATTGPGELAHQLFNYPGTKLLLLSATPYKPFTYAEESGDDHHTDFLRTLEFLDPDVAQQVAADLTEYRDAATQGRPVVELAARLRKRLLLVMSRSERPVSVTGRMLEEHISTVEDLSPTDLLDYVRLRQLSDLVKGDISLEYWKSTPYFVNFCEGYKLSEQLKTRLKGPERQSIAPAVAALTRLDRDAAESYGDVNLGNGKLRALARQTIDAGWWKLLWLPPSLPYLKPTGPYAEPWAQGITKRLVFSSWSATPTAIAGLLSQRAVHELTKGTTRADPTDTGRLDVRSLLDYRLDGARPAAMTTLALFWPMPGLAAQADPLAAAGVTGAPVPARALEAELRKSLRGGAAKWKTVAVAEAARVAFADPGSLPPGLRAGGRGRVIQALSAIATDNSDTSGARGLSAHVDEALVLGTQGVDIDVAAVAPTLAALAAHSPANIAWRALRRVVRERDSVTDAALWEAAAVLATGLRSLFNRAESILLLEKLYDGGAYWQKVLRYCAAGNLQAVLDEYLHHLANETHDDLTDTSLRALADTAAAAISLRPSTYGAFDPDQPDTTISLSSRIALRYGGRRNDENIRQPDVRRSFNSPFWPFVLASTSVGQEGIDFHWWCSAIVHWNTPANPVDFEQREGRIDRYRGHAVRRNLAHRHNAAMLRADDPWSAAYELGKDEQIRLGEFAPHWVYPGPAKIERHLSTYPLSVDLARLERVKSDLALYRLTFGQPRQEDMLELLRNQGVEMQPERMAELRIDLSPP
jgi:hypothetical protein